MVDPAALANARLRRVEVKDKSAAALPQANEAQRFDSYFHRVREADLESWYPKLAHLTYPTTFVPITVADAKAILARYAELSTLLKITAFRGRAALAGPPFRFFPASYAVAEANKAAEASPVLTALARRLDEEIAKYGSEGAFAKVRNGGRLKECVSVCAWRALWLTS